MKVGILFRQPNQQCSGVQTRRNPDAFIAGQAKGSKTTTVLEYAEVLHNKTTTLKENKYNIGLEHDFSWIKTDSDIQSWVFLITHLSS